MAAIRVFLVDDSPAFLRAMDRLLGETLGVEVVGQATSATQALAVIPLVSPDAVLLDLQMPGMDGLEATRQIKQQESPPLVVIVTLHDDTRFRAASEAAGADGFVAKQRLVGDLFPLLARLMARRKRKSGNGQKNGLQPQ
jgi:DNA-binding NarL/FixJ family response regulator